MKKKKQQLNAYYAHSMRKYGTQEEADERAYIESVYSGKVTCPKRDLGELGSMARYLEFVSTVDAVYATEYKNHVGKGVYDECRHALSLNIPVFLVRKSKKGFCHFRVKGVKRSPELHSWDTYGKLVVDTSEMFEYLEKLKKMIETKKGKG
jgi:hypothetical protein